MREKTNRRDTEAQRIDFRTLRASAPLRLGKINLSPDLILYHQITPPHFCGIGPAQHLKTSVGKNTPKVLRLDETTSVKVRKVNDVQYTCPPDWHGTKRVIEFCGENAHGVRRVETRTALRVCLRKKFGHPIFSVNSLNA